MQTTAIEQAGVPLEIPAIRLGTNLRFMESAVEIILGRKIFIDNFTEETRYFIMIAVCDYVRLGEIDPNKQILSALKENHKNDIQQSRATLILDLSNEGPQYDCNLFQNLIFQLDKYNLPHNNVVFVCQNRQLGDNYRQSFGGDGLRFWTLDYFPITIANLFDERRQNLFSDGYSPIKGTKDKIFNCFNSAPRWHRVILYRWLQERGHLPHGLVSFHGTSTLNPKGNEIDINNPPSHLKEDFSNLIQNLSAFLPAEPLQIDNSSVFGNALSTSIPFDVYNRTNLSIVTESDFFDTQTERITEKTIKAAAMGLPFILVGPKRSIALIRELGFKTFDNLIDHSYDELEDLNRMKAAMRAIDNCVARITSDHSGWQEASEKDAIFNYNHAKCGLVERFNQTVVAPITEEMQKFIRGT